MKFVKWLMAVSVLAFIFTGCIVVTNDAKRFTVTYKTTKEFSSDSATLQYTDASGSIVNGSFSGNAFNQVVTVNDGELVELRASNIFGNVTLTMTVERISDKSLLFEQTKTCSSGTTNCTLVFTTP